jgi:hypothetical protein
MHRSLPSSARLAWAPSVSSTSTYCSDASAPPSSVSGGVISVRKIYTECNASSGDVIVCCLIQLWVGHVYLNKHSSSVSLLGRLLVVHELLFLFHI